MDMKELLIALGHYKSLVDTCDRQEMFSKSILEEFKVEINKLEKEAWKILMTD